MPVITELIFIMTLNFLTDDSQTNKEENEYIFYLLTADESTRPIHR